MGASRDLSPHFGPDGLVPVIVQDEADGRVLMLAYADVEALEATVVTGDLHFHSRSRDRLWRKGETSGHVLHLVRLDQDCDADAILATVRPHGPTCHRGTRSCFDSAPADPMTTASSAPDPAEDGFAWLDVLWRTIDERRSSPPSESYTARLLRGGVDAAGRKVVEEATEVLMAAKDDAVAESAGVDRGATAEALAGEGADLLYHLLVLLAERGTNPGQVIDVLRDRHAR